MNVKQYSVKDWVNVFLTDPGAESQVEIIKERVETGKPLATWERNCLKAYEQIQRSK